MPEGHTLFRLAREQTEAVRRPPGARDQPAGPLRRRRRTARRAACSRASAPTASTCSPTSAPDTLHVHLGLYGNYAAAPASRRPPRGALRMRWEGPGPDGDGRVDRPARPHRLRGAGPAARWTASSPGSGPTRCGRAPTPPWRTAASPAAGRRSARCSWTSRCSPASATCTAPSCCSGTASRRSARAADVDDDAVGADVGRPRRPHAGRRPARPDRDHPPGGPVTPAAGRPCSGRTRTTSTGAPGLPCRVCGTEIRTEAMVGRNLYWCPACQARADGCAAWC